MRLTTQRAVLHRIAPLRHTHLIVIQHDRVSRSDDLSHSDPRDGRPGRTSAPLAILRAKHLAWLRVVWKAAEGWPWREQQHPRGTVQTVADHGRSGDGHQVMAMTDLHASQRNNTPHGRLKLRAWAFAVASARGPFDRAAFASATGCVAGSSRAGPER